jgi:zinc transporter ZupT
MSAVLLSLAAFFSTFAGGLFALKFRDRLHFILSFTAGVLLAVVSFDILPEIFELAREQQLDATGAMIALVVGFLFFHALEKFVLMLYLGFFAGFLLYIGASDILPEAHSQNRPAITGSLIALTCLGAAFIFVVVRVVG